MVISSLSTVSHYTEKSGGIYKKNAVSIAKIAAPISPSNLRANPADGMPEISFLLGDNYHYLVDFLPPYSTAMLAAAEEPQYSGA